ncbi:MAG: hypothetical protein HOO67_03850 [Candidatus Peribacteraceae bacterium]|nr:hypothetical protein [Candidatus Peribacteraceae bacterium]
MNTIGGPLPPGDYRKVEKILPTQQPNTDAPPKEPDTSAKENMEEKPGFARVISSVVEVLSSEETIRKKVDHTIKAVAYLLGASTDSDRFLAAQKIREDLATETASTDAAKAYGKKDK